MYRQLILSLLGICVFKSFGLAGDTAMPIETKRAAYILTTAVSTGNINTSNCRVTVGYQEDNDQIFISISHSASGGGSPVAFNLQGSAEAFIVRHDEEKSATLQVRNRIDKPENNAQRTNFYFYQDLSSPEKFTSIMGLRETYKMVNEGTVYEPKITAKWVRDENPYFLCYLPR